MSSINLNLVVQKGVAKPVGNEAVYLIDKLSPKKEKMIYAVLDLCECLTICFFYRDHCIVIPAGHLVSHRYCLVSTEGLTACDLDINPEHRHQPQFT